MVDVSEGRLRPLGLQALLKAKLMELVYHLSSHLLTFNLSLRRTTGDVRVTQSQRKTYFSSISKIIRDRRWS